MKSKKTCYDPAISHVTLKRFAPICLLYTLGLVLLTVGKLNANGYHGNAVLGIQELCPFAVVCNLAYAPVLAQLLMGDLYTPRLGYALHALPITLGGWFGTQVILGILSVLPGILLSAGFMLTVLTRYQIVILYWMAAALLSFLFFFGLALLCSVAAGNRIGMLLLYCIANFWGLFYSWTRIRILSPLIYGMYLPGYDAQFVPITTMLRRAPFVIIYQEQQPNYTDGPVAYFGSLDVDHLNFSNSYLWILLAFAAAGCVFIGLAMYLLRRRRPECAGDLLAFRPMAPVLLVLCSVFTGILFHVISNTFGGQLGYPMMFIGMIVGYYAMLMLLRRQTRVFTKKSILPLALILVITLAGITATGLNLFGFTYKVPEVNQVEQVVLDVWGCGNPLESSRPEDIALAIQVQEECLGAHRQAERQRPLLERIYGDEETAPSLNKDDDDYTGRVSIVYTLKNGKTLSRLYYLFPGCECLEPLRLTFSAPEYIFARGDSTGTFLDENGKFDRQQLMDMLQGVQLTCWHEQIDELTGDLTSRISDDDIPGLIDAILADCEAGNIAQSYIFHTDESYTDSLSVYYVDTRVNPLGYTANFFISLYSANVNTFNYLIAHGYHPPLEALGSPVGEKATA